MTDFFPMYYENYLGPWDAFNPRYLFSQPGANELMSRLIKQAGVYPEDEPLLAKFLAAGMVVRKGSAYNVTIPYFTNEDVSILRKVLGVRAAQLGTLIQENFSALTTKSPTERLILLGDLVFDGNLFAWLATENLVCDGHLYGGDRDYLINFYEAKGTLAAYANSLICSNNRASLENIGLASFGDSQSLRRDLFRWLMVRQNGQAKNFPQFSKLESLVTPTISVEELKELVLAGVEKVLQGKTPTAVQREILIELKYLTPDNLLRVPVIQKNEAPALSQSFIALCGQQLRKDFAAFPQELVQLSALQNGVDYWLLTNEIWHCYFGMINEELIQKNYFQIPKADETGGRYQRFIQI